MGMGTTPHTKQILWLTDLHLDRASSAHRKSLYREIRRSPANTILITGDISVARHLPLHLRELAAAAAWRQVFFVLGNHDFDGSTLAQVDSCVAGICRSHRNLRHLGHGEILRLDGGTALVGHRGWGDGKMGWGARSFARNPDFHAIGDFRGLDRKAAFKLLGRLGSESALYLRGIMPYALTCYDHILVATHVPPMTQAALYDERPCDWLRQPFFCNIAAGAFLHAISTVFAKKSITVLCGHTHSAARLQATPNLEIRVGGARPGRPRAQGMFEISAGGLVEKEHA